MQNTVATDYTLFAPKVRYTSTFDGEFDAMSTWCAQLELGYLDERDDDAPQVVGGYAEFAIINVGEHPIDDLLDSLDANHFSALFDGADVAPAVQEQWEDAPFNRILIVTHVEIAEPLRGQDLGLWLVAEVIARMSSPIDTLVLLYPDPAAPRVSAVAEVTGAEALMRYWQRCGLVPIGHRPQFLGATTAYSYLARARTALRSVNDVRITVPASLIGQELPDDLRHTIMTNLEPVGLRLVRD